MIGALVLADAAAARRSMQLPSSYVETARRHRGGGRNRRRHYLPLAGGDLTGALTGTTAVFSARSRSPSQPSLRAPTNQELCRYHRRKTCKRRSACLPRT